MISILPYLDRGDKKQAPEEKPVANPSSSISSLEERLRGIELEKVGADIRYLIEQSEVLRLEEKKENAKRVVTGYMENFYPIVGVEDEWETPVLNRIPVIRAIPVIANTVRGIFDSQYRREVMRNLERTSYIVPINFIRDLMDAGYMEALKPVDLDEVVGAMEPTKKIRRNMLDVFRDTYRSASRFFAKKESDPAPPFIRLS